jgi:hypothetical protein
MEATKISGDLLGLWQDPGKQLFFVFWVGKQSYPPPPRFFSWKGFWAGFWVGVFVALWGVVLWLLTLKVSVVSVER